MAETTREVASEEEILCNKNTSVRTAGLNTEKTQKKLTGKTRRGKTEKGKLKQQTISNGTTAQRRRLDEGNNHCEFRGKVASVGDNSCKEIVSTRTAGLNTEKTQRKPTGKTRYGKTEKGKLKEKTIPIGTTARKRRLDEGNNHCETTDEVPSGEESSCNENVSAKSQRKFTGKTRCEKREKGQQKESNVSKRTTAQKRKLDQGNNHCDAAQDDTDIEEIHTSNVCDNCGTNTNVNHYCVNCPGNLCETCKNSHANVNLHKTHQVIQRGKQLLSSKTSTCEQHLKKICMYCKQCKAPCCLECIARNHNAHGIIRIKDVYKQAEKNLSAYLEKIENDFLPEPAKLKTIIQDRKLDMQKRKHDSETYAVTAIQAAQLELEKIEQDMKERIKSVFDKEEQGLLKLELDVYQNETKLNDIATTYRKLLKDNSDHTVLMANVDKPDLQSIELPELTLPMPYNLEEGSWNLKIKHLSCGNFKEKADDQVFYRPQSKFGPEASLTSLNFDPCLIAPTVIETSLINESESEFLKCMAITYNNEVWIQHCSSVVLYKTCNGKLKKKMVVPLQCNTINDLVMTEDNVIFVTCKFSKSIIRITTTGFSTLIYDIAPFKPSCILVNKTGNVVVGVDVAEENSTNYKLVIYSPDLKEVVQVIENDSSGLAIFRDSVTKLVQNGNEDFVGIMGTSNVVCVSCDSVQRWEYKDFGLRDIVCDKYDNVIICNSCVVSILSSDGQLIINVMDKMNALISLTIDKKGVLWILHNPVVSCQKVISKLKYLD